MKLCLFGPGLMDEKGPRTGNLGNPVIQQPVIREIERLFAGWEAVRLSTFWFPGPEERRHLRSADLTLAGPPIC